MTDHFHDVYAGEAGAYHRLVMAEDASGALAETLHALGPFDGADVIEAGAGTGRITKLLLSAGARSVLATEPAEAMRAIAAHHLRDFHDRCTIAAATVDALPAPDASHDLAIAGWVVGHFADWHPDAWREHVDRAIAELLRVLRPGGLLVLIESLGTGNTTPKPPSAHHADYYAHLETHHGMTRAGIRTDYGFATVDEAVEVMGFFFGERLCATIRDEGWRVVPECTGVWHVRKPTS